MDDRNWGRFTATALGEESIMVTGNRERARRKWAASDVIKGILELSTVAPNVVQNSQPWLYGAAVRHFGSWRAVVVAAGVKYDKKLGRRAPGFWCQPKVMQAIRRLEDKTSTYVRRRDRGLYSALRLFGSWGSAVTHAGYSYEDITRGWLAIDNSGMRFRKKR